MRAETYREALMELQMTILDLRSRIAELEENNSKTLEEIIDEYRTCELIFKEDVMDVIESIRQRGVKREYHDDALMIAHEIKSAVLDMESVAKTKERKPAQPEQRWIPCSERLPEENGEYLVTRESSSYRYIDIVKKSNCNSHLPMASDIKAWMPLPEPWKGEQHG